MRPPLNTPATGTGEASILTAGKYGAIGRPRGDARPNTRDACAPRKPALNAKHPTLNIFLPKPEMLIRWDEFMWQELREGGYLQRYIGREKHTAVARHRAASRRMQGFRNNTKSSLELKAAVPARDYFRWREVDKDFWNDDSNLRSLRRDNPDLSGCIFNC